MASPVTVQRNTRLSGLKRWLGFDKTYNLVLWCISSGVILSFLLLRTWAYSGGEGYLKSELAPGEYYMMKQTRHRTGYLIHVAAVIPCGILSTPQFIPAIRKRWVKFHRINGYVVFILLTIGVLSSSATTNGFGGDLSIHSSCAFLSFITLSSGFLSYYNARCLQLDQHRKWILRTMFYMGCVVTFRPLYNVIVAFVAINGTYWSVWQCEQLADLFLGEDRVLTDVYPTCSNLSNSVAVVANLLEMENVGSCLRVAFGTTLWASIVIHMIGVEIYIHLTPGESERLRLISWRRQKEAGMEPAGSVGTTSDRIGDAKWVHPKESAEGLS